MTRGEQSLRGVEFQENYSSSGGSLLNDFYIPALSNSVSYDRATGYFSSAILALAPIVFSEYVTRGGKIRLLCSPHLSSADAEAIRDLAVTHQPEPLSVAATSLAALAHGTDLEKRAVQCLRALIDAELLEIKFVTSGKTGLFHDKIGIFADSSGQKASFIGSANETAAAWSGFANHEQIEVFTNWSGEANERRCARHEDLFDETWQGLRRGLTVTSSGDAADVIKSVIPAEALAEIVEAFRASVEHAELQPDVIQLRDYQADVLQSWEANSHHGVVAFATGGGKTRTALEAIRRWTTSGRPALILVPSELLHRQWAVEIQSLIPSAVVLQVGAGHSRDGWSRRLADYTRDDTTLGQRIVLATYQTAATDRFLDLLHHGDHLLVVGDEVHRVGATDTRRVLREVAAGGRLGLSATPERFGDPAGTEAIFHYFGQILSPEFTLRDALEAQVLVPYDYDFVTCPLTADELDKWDVLSKQVAQEIARNKGEMTERALHLLRQRARISKRAVGKAAIAATILAKHYRDGDRWLVYCNDVEHLREVRREISGLGMDLLEYHSQDSGDHNATLQYFTNRGGVLLAIKCLDEGVDIPLINRALILASSTNPREYVQRRGRVLRRSPGKYSAQIFDVLVTGADGLAITPSEVVRAMEFAEDSRNVGPALHLEQLLPAAGSHVAANAPDIEED
jgi:superfamily II DNA or RNA helicase